jgi:hypothetical protein
MSVIRLPETGAAARFVAMLPEATGNMVRERIREAGIVLPPAVTPHENRHTKRARAVVEASREATKPAPVARNARRSGKRELRARRRSDWRQVRAEKRAADYARAYEYKMRDRGIDPTITRFVPRPLWVRASCALDDKRVCQQLVHSIADRERRAAVLRAALVPVDEPARRHKYRWSDLHARRTAVLGWLLCELARNNNRPGKWSGLVMGIPQSALRKMLKDPQSGDVPSLGALTGRHRRGGSLQTGQVGYLRRLIEAGLIHETQQLPEHDAEACELLGPAHRVQLRSGDVVWLRFATARYWLVTDPSRRMQPDEVRDTDDDLLSQLQRSLESCPPCSDPRSRPMADAQGERPPN